MAACGDVEQTIPVMCARCPQRVLCYHSQNKDPLMPSIPLNIVQEKEWFMEQGPVAEHWLADLLAAAAAKDTVKHTDAQSAYTAAVSILKNDYKDAIKEATARADDVIQKVLAGFPSQFHVISKTRRGCDDDDDDYEEPECCTHVQMHAPSMADVIYDVLRGSLDIRNASFIFVLMSNRFHTSLLNVACCVSAFKRYADGLARLNEQYVMELEDTRARAPEIVRKICKRIQTKILQYVERVPVVYDDEITETFEDDTALWFSRQPANAADESVTDSEPDADADADEKECFVDKHV